LSNKKTLIIAEAGVNHNGSIKNAKKLIDVASDAGADIIKFQTFSPEDIVLRNTKKAQYQRKGSKRNQTQYQMLKKLELKFSEHIELFKYCKKKKIEFLSTAFDFKSINLLKKLRLKRNKIPSGEITNYPYLKEIAKISKPILLSTGMSTYREISEALNILKKSKNYITLLHCNSAYPTPYKDVNLKVLNEMRKRFNLPVGYSDHTLGYEVSLAAVVLGASVIEKHITLNRKMKGPDHSSSLEPSEIKAMVKAIRNIEQSMGHSKKKPTKSEFKNIFFSRKSIVAKTNINKGDKFSEYNLTTKRPAKGLSPMKWTKIIGKKSNRNYKKEDLIKN
tara:strand:- start:2378 stop:3379 length:1002 start_codon:yes stop_codon:yes gene_type:complete